MDPVIITVSYEQRRKILAGVSSHSDVSFPLDAAGSFWLNAYPWIVFQPLMTPEPIVHARSSAEETGNPAR